MIGAGSAPMTIALALSVVPLSLSGMYRWIGAKPVAEARGFTRTRSWGALQVGMAVVLASPEIRWLGLMILTATLVRMLLTSFSGETQPRSAHRHRTARDVMSWSELGQTS